MKMLIDFRDHLIEKGLLEVQGAYPPGSPKREGTTEGFELCRSLATLDEYRTVLDARRKREHRMKRGFHPEVEERIRRDLAAAGVEPMGGDPIVISHDDFKRYRYATLQIEFVYERLLLLSGETETIGMRALGSTLEFLKGLRQ